MALDDEQKRQISDCLRKSSIDLATPQRLKLVERIEASIKKYMTSVPELTPGAVRKELETIYSLAEQADPPIGQIRSLVSKLSPQATDHIETRGEIVFPNLFPNYPYSGDFKLWATDLPGLVLVDAVRMIVSTGGQLVQGRSRGEGRRSRAHCAPRILGTVKGSSDDTRRSGRPEKWLEFELVMHLASDWAISTEQFPDLRRSDHSGFGDLVHSVFQWCCLSEGEATYSLRRYKAEIEASENRERGRSEEGDDL
jgi:hypothetical protein